MKAGYVRGDTLLGAPYDFRKAANEQGKYIKEEQVNLNGFKLIKQVNSSESLNC